MVNQNYGTAEPTALGTSEQTIQDEESPLLLSSGTPDSKVKPLVGVGTIIAVLLLGMINKVSIPRHDPNILRRIHF